MTLSEHKPSTGYGRKLVLASGGLVLLLGFMFWWSIRANPARTSFLLRNAPPEAVAENELASTPVLRRGGSRAVDISANQDDSLIANDLNSAKAPERSVRNDNEAELHNGILSNHDIDTAMLQQSGYFKRCALSHLTRLNKQRLQQGQRALVQNDIEVNLRFKVASNGRASEATVHEKPQDNDSTVADEEFARCMEEVVYRVPFPKFSGKPIVISGYTLHIE